MNSGKLIGFAGSLRGNEAGIVTADPVIKLEQRVFVAIAGRLDGPSLREVTPDQERFIHRFPGQQTRSFAPGHVIALAGPQLVEKVERTSLSAPALLPMARILKSWQPTHRNFSWALVEPDELADLRIRGRNALEPLLLRALANRLSTDNGYTTTYFKLFTALSPTEDEDYFLTQGLYLQQMHDEHALQLLFDYAPSKAPALRSKRRFQKLLRQRTAAFHSADIASTSEHQKVAAPLPKAPALNRYTLPPQQQAPYGRDRPNASINNLLAGPSTTRRPR